MLLEVKNIKVHYQRVEALKGVSLEIEPGEIITLLGTNGAGKTTTLKTISGLRKPTSGEIWFQGVRIDKKAPQDIVKLGIAHVPENRRVFANMTVLENLEMGAYLNSNKRQIDRDMEVIYGHFPVLKDRHKQPAGKLSGGEQQMLATARALMARPKLLLMDEPSLGLSPLLVKEVFKIIANINKDGVAIVLVEQNARMAIRVANRAYVLELGSIVLQGSSNDLTNNDYIREAYMGG